MKLIIDRTQQCAVDDTLTEREREKVEHIMLPDLFN